MNELTRLSLPFVKSFPQGITISLHMHTRKRLTVPNRNDYHRVVYLKRNGNSWFYFTLKQIKSCVTAL